MKISKEDKQRLVESITWEAYPWNKGGQNVAMIPRGVRLNCLDLGVEICINIERSQIENRAIALNLFGELLKAL